MSSRLERLNLNLPGDARVRLKRLAKSSGETEARYARELLVDAIERSEKASFKRRLEASRTPERRARDLEIAAAIERFRG